MKESYGKDPASHPDPESCVGGREDAGEALTGAHAGQPLSSEITLTGVPTPYGEGEGNMADGAKREPAANAAESETLSMRGNSSREKREIPRVPAGGAAGRPETQAGDLHVPGIHPHLWANPRKQRVHREAGDCDQTAPSQADRGRNSPRGLRTT
jgi:RNA-directed DNA polymerase